MAEESLQPLGKNELKVERDPRARSERIGTPRSTTKHVF
jgi:hypothetical protein